MPPMINPDNLSPSFSGRALACARGGNLVFARLDFRLDPGECLVLTGANGSGKSSLLRLMAGLLRPMVGMLEWSGTPINSDSDHGGRLAYLGHQDMIKPVLSAWENLRFMASLHGVNPREDALEPFGIAHLAHIPGRMLSAGQRRRVALSRLIAAPVPLWLLDEPTNALDRASIATLETLIARHRAAGGMVVLSTHSQINLGDANTLNIEQYAPKAEDRL
jgi:heme exporter protein A